MANTPLQIEVEDVQILVAASATTAYSREDEENRVQQLKQERLERAEAIRFGESTGVHTTRTLNMSGLTSTPRTTLVHAIFH